MTMPSMNPMMTFRKGARAPLAVRACALLLSVAMLLPAFAEDAKPVAPPAPDPAAAIDKLLQVDPAGLAKQLGAMRAEADAKTKEAADLRAQADANEAKLKELQTRIDALTAQAKALSAALGVPAATPAPMAMAAAAPATPAMAPAAPAGAKLTNFQDDVLPILKQRCASCHNPDKRKSGLSVTTFAHVMEGGGSGKIVNAGDPDGSRLIKLVEHKEQPYMPPSGDPLSPEQITVLRKWIADGAPADANAGPMVKADASAAKPAETFVAATFADTPPMPAAAMPAAALLPGRGVVARAVDANPRSPLLAVGAYREVLFYNLDNNTLLGALPFAEGDIFSLSFSVNGELLAVGGGEEGATGICAIYEVRTGKRLGAYGELYDTVLAAAISPDNRMIALGGPNAKVRVYDTASGKELYGIDAHTDWIYAVKFSPDGELLATADRSGGLYLWQAANGRPVEQLRGHEGAINALDYTADSTVLVSCGNDGTIREWDTWKYTAIRNFKAHGLPVLYVNVNAKNEIVSCSAERAAKIWNLEGKEVRAIPNLPDWCYQACWAKGGSVVAAGTWDGSISLWAADSGQAVAKLNTNPAPAKQG